MKLYTLNVILGAMLFASSSATLHGRRAPTCRPLSINTIITTSPVPTTVTTTTSITTTTTTSTASASALTTFYVRGSNSGTTADGAILQATQGDNKLLLFNPFEPGSKPQALTLDPTTGFVYNGTSQLCSPDSAVNNPSGLLVCDAGTAGTIDNPNASGGSTPLVCSMSTGTLQCQITARGGRGIWTVFQLFIEYGMEELFIGSTLDSRFHPVTLNVFPVIGSVPNY